MDKRIIWIWILSAIATSGSLYFSEIKGFIPCTLCWYQRIFMYPIFLLTSTSLLLKDKKINNYLLTLSIPGFLLALYHVLLQKTSLFSSFEPCSVGVSCASEYVNWFGFVTIPLLSFTAFFLISITLIYKKEG